MTEYSRMAKGRFTAAGHSAVINLPFQPDFVELYNYTVMAANGGTNRTAQAWWDASLIVSGNNPTMIEGYGSGSTLVYDVITNSATNPAINSFYAGLMLQYGPRKQVVASTKGTTTSFQVTGHGYAVGDTVIFEGLYQSATTGMPQMAGIQFTIITITDANNFIVNFDSSGSAYTNLSGSPAGAFVKKVLYPFLYVPQVSVITAITTGATTTIQTADYHNLEPGQEIAFRIPSLWGTTQLNSLPNPVIPGSPVYGYVVSITDNWTFVCNINSSAFTAFTSNIAVSSVPGLSFPQVLAVGDVNSGGLSIYTAGVNGFLTTSPLYPPPNFPTSTNRIPTINGPAIKGAFVNNTRMGFTIGAGTATNNTSMQIMNADDVVEWRAFLHDIQ